MKVNRLRDAVEGPTAQGLFGDLHITPNTLRRMKGPRNLLVREYGRVNDELVFETIRARLGDFDAFKREILAFLRQPLSPPAP